MKRQAKNTKSAFSKSMTEAMRSEWSTPLALFHALNREFQFTLDACARADNALCGRYFTKEQNGLLQSWRGERVYTTDVIKLKADGVPDLDFCESYNYGVIRLFDQIQRAVRNKWHQDLDDYMVEAILQGKIDPGEQIRNTVHEAVQLYAKNLVHTLQEKGVDLSISYPIFLGGGSLLMKDFIAAELQREDYLYIEDVRANAVGYALLTRAKLGNMSSSNKA